MEINYLHLVIMGLATKFPPKSKDAHGALSACRKMAFLDLPARYPCADSDQIQQRFPWILTLLHLLPSALFCCLSCYRNKELLLDSEMEDQLVGKWEGDHLFRWTSSPFAFNCRMVLLSAPWLAAASFYLLTWKWDNQILAAGQIQGSLDSQGKMLVVSRSLGLASQIPLWDSDAKCSLTRALGESEQLAGAARECSFSHTLHLLFCCIFFIFFFPLWDNSESQQLASQNAVMQRSAGLGSWSSCSMLISQKSVIVAQAILGSGFKLHPSLRHLGAFQV